MAVAMLASVACGQAVAVTDSESSVVPAHAVRQRARLNRPIAFGYVAPDGSVDSGSQNFTVTWVPEQNWYVITVTGLTYYYTQYSTNVTTSIPQGNGWCQTDSANGQLLVRCYNLAGQPVQAAFGFSIF